MAVYGLIAGNGSLPVELIKALIAQGKHAVVAGVGDSMAAELLGLATIYKDISPGMLGDIISFFKDNGVDTAVMAGKVSKEQLYRGIPMDVRFKLMLSKLSDYNDDTMLRALADEFQTDGILIADQSELLKQIMPEETILTKRQPSKQDILDITYGFSIAKHVGLKDIGQTVVVKNRAVMAVEAIEGTDQCIRRGGLLAGKDAVIVKVAKPYQDMRFDIPTVGIDTIKAMVEVKASVLAIESGKTFLIDKNSALDLADEHGISIVVTSGEASISQDREAQ